MAPTLPELRAVLFGSRAKGTHKAGSDIDLALVGEHLDWRTIGRIYDALDDLLLPFRFSLVHYGAATDPEVSGHIARVGITLFERAAARAVADDGIDHEAKRLRRVD